MVNYPPKQVDSEQASQQPKQLNTITLTIEQTNLLSSNLVVILLYKLHWPITTI